MGNSFGSLFKISSWGESHGGGIGLVLDGCPPRLPLSVDDIQPALERRRPGQSKLTTPRNESDQIEILSGVFEGKTIGTPIAMLVRNKDARPQAYDEMKEKFRPSHADFTYQKNTVFVTTKVEADHQLGKQSQGSQLVQSHKKFWHMIKFKSQLMSNAFIIFNRPN